VHRLKRNEHRLHCAKIYASYKLKLRQSSKYITTLKKVPIDFPLYDIDATMTLSLARAAAKKNILLLFVAIVSMDSVCELEHRQK
jgi:hypothetical protein